MLKAYYNLKLNKLTHKVSCRLNEKKVTVLTIENKTIQIIVILQIQFTKKLGSLQGFKFLTWHLQPTLQLTTKYWGH